MDILVYLLVALQLLSIILLFIVLRNRAKEHPQDILSALKRLEEQVTREGQLMAQSNQIAFRNQREELLNSFKTLGESHKTTLLQLSQEQQKHLEAFKMNVSDLGKMQTEKFQEQIARITQLRDENAKQLQEMRGMLEIKVAGLQESTAKQLQEMRAMLEEKIKTLQEENSKKLEEMRQTVDEKLRATVEQRFDQSFKVISLRLEAVQKGLGEMQTLAAGVGDLKKVLTNVKTRGNLGEIQLGTILDEILAPEQYLSNARINPSTQEVVEFAIKLPGRREDDKPVLLPIDSKFPVEDYQRLLDAYELSDDTRKAEIERTGRLFDTAVKKAANDIRNKYIMPPITTNFAILFVPTEGLYAEIVRRPDLFQVLQREYRVTVVGPSNLAAYLSSLQMGFRTLAIEKRSSEVWELLAAVKTEFTKFGGVLAKTKKKLQEASNVIDQAAVRTRAIDRKLRDVHQLPASESQRLLETENLNDPPVEE